jgi:hypothetical protein
VRALAAVLLLAVVTCAPTPPPAPPQADRTPPVPGEPPCRTENGVTTCKVF